MPQPENSGGSQAIFVVGAMGFAAAAALYSSNPEAISSEDATKLLMLGKTCASMALVTASAFATAQLYPIGKEIYEATFPTEEQKAAQEAKTVASRKRLAILKTEGELVGCLMRSRANVQIRTSGIPMGCEEAARFYELAAGTAELEKMIKTFNRK